VQVLELWRYPVKSMQGEQLSVAEVVSEGLVGDRGWALFDVGTGLGLTARRVPDLLFAAGRLREIGTAGGRRTEGGSVQGGGTESGAVEVVLPDGTVTADDAVLSDWLGRRVALRRADTVAAARYETPDDDESAAGANPDATRWHEWQGAAGAFHDIAAARVSLITTGTLGTWDRRRFRSNVLLDGAGEGRLIGSRVRVGGVVLDVNDPISRCVMVTRPQPGGIGRDTSVLKTIHREHGGNLAVGAQVQTPGTVRTGDVLQPA
jgi:uncharacterized protein YcbX